MGKIGQIRVNDRIGSIDFCMDGNRLAAVHNGNRFWIDDLDIKDEYQHESSVKDHYIDSGLIGLEPGKNIRIPLTVLKTRDVIRINRKNDENRERYIFIHEQYEPFGLVEFAMFSSVFLIFHEGRHATIGDDMIKHTENGIQVPALLKGIPVPHIYITEDVLKNRDRIRAFYERESHFKPIGEVGDIEIFLSDDSKLVLRHGMDEIVTDMIETIHGRPAVYIESLKLGHPYLELPAEVVEAFRKTQGKKIPEGLQLVSVGTSLLNGCEFFKLNKDLPEETFKKVKVYFTHFDCEGDFSGWLTMEPARVAEKLGIA